MARHHGVGGDDPLPQQLLRPQVKLAVLGQGLHDVVEHLGPRHACC